MARDQFLDATEIKLIAQRDYVLWRDSLPGYGKHHGMTPHKEIDINRFPLPEADPGNDVVYRWRAKLVVRKGEPVDFDAVREESKLFQN